MSDDKEKPPIKPKQRDPLKLGKANRTPYRPFSKIIEELTSYEKQIVDPETGYAMTLEKVTVDMPIELKVTVNPDGTVKLTGSAPTQLVETTIMPVFHHMRLRVVREDGE